MKYLILFFLISSLKLIDLENSEKNYIRHIFYYSIESKDSLVLYQKKIIQCLNKLPNDPFLVAYYGAYEALVAKHSINLYTKYKFIKQGLEKITKAIKFEPQNLEYRFLRLSILHHLPSILGYNDLLYEDINITIQLIQKENYSIVNKKTQIGIIEFLLNSNRLTNEQIKTLQELINKIK